jgi:hypothetical protein
MEITNRQWEITVTRALGDQWPDMQDRSGSTFRPDTVNVALEALDGVSVPRLLPVTVSGVMTGRRRERRAMVDVQLDDKTPPWVVKTVEAACISVRLRDGGDDEPER